MGDADSRCVNRPTSRPASERQDTAPPNERGAAMLEFALISVILFTLLFGLIEGGLLVRARNAIDNASDDAARRGAIAANDQLADWMILQQIRARGAIEAASINFVVVYKAENSSEPPPAACLGGVGVPDVCNVYQRADFEESSGAFGCASPNLDGNWCPVDRDGSDGVEFLGVWIDATHKGVTGLLGDVDLQGRSGQAVEGTLS